MEKAFKFRLYPSKDQCLLMERTFGCCRFVYNDALAARIHAYQNVGVSLSKYDCVKRLPALKEQYPWLSEVDAIALQAAIENMDAAYQQFFKGLKAGRKVGFPKFKSKRRSKAVYRTKMVGSNIQVNGHAVKLPKLGWVKCKVSTPVTGRVVSATVSRSRSGKYFVSLCCTDVATDPLPATGTVVGIDLGLHDLVITSDGEKYPNPKYLKASEAKLARLQRQMSRKTKDSYRWNKARLQVARLQEHIANQRQDSLQKLTTELVRSYDVICLESLAPKNMVRNRKLSKSISDVAWGELTRQLQYKAEWYGRQVVQIDRFYPSSQLCSCCGFRNPVLKDLSIRSWVCPACGVQHDRDVNAAENILAEGLRLLA